MVVPMDMIPFAPVGRYVLPMEHNHNKAIFGNLKLLMLLTFIDLSKFRNKSKDWVLLGVFI